MKNRPNRLLPVVLIGGLVTAGLAVVLLMVARLPPRPSQALPTLAVLPSSAPTQEIAARPSATVPATAAPTTMPAVQPNASSVGQPTVQASETAIPSPVPTIAATSVVLLRPTTIAAVSSGIPVTSTAMPLPTQTGVVNPPTDLPTEVVVPAAPPATSVPTAQTAPGNGTALNFPARIAEGEFMVISATRHAETAIRDLGGDVPAAPSGQSWLLVELLLNCGQQPSCAFDSSAVSVVDASRAEFRPAADFKLAPLFGSYSRNGQVWGYLGFTVPDNAGVLKLAVSEAQKVYWFELQ